MQRCAMKCKKKQCAFLTLRYSIGQVLGQKSTFTTESIQFKKVAYFIRNVLRLAPLAL